MRNVYLRERSWQSWHQCRYRTATLAASLLAFVVSVSSSLHAVAAGPNSIPAKSGTTRDTARSAAGSIRHLEFPKDFMIGKLELTGKEFRTGRDASSDAKPIKGAQGSVTVEVPPGFILLLEANQHLFAHPECLNTISNTGIDIFDLSMLPIDEGEDGSTDKALRYIGRFKELKFLNVDRSDASDTGLANVKNMPGLEGISCFMSGVQGKCFKEFQTLPKLNRLDLSGCPVDKSNLQFLAAIPKLDCVCLSRNKMTNDSVRIIAKIPNLKTLILSSNPKLTDDCLKDILSMKKLEYLDVRGTGITARALKSLAPMKLRKLMVPKTYTPDEMAMLKKSMPPTEIKDLHAGEVSSEMKTIFAPLR